MEIYLIASQYLPVENAQVRRIAAWAQVLYNNGFTVTVICGNIASSTTKIDYEHGYRVIKLGLQQNFWVNHRQKKSKKSLSYRLFGWFSLIFNGLSPESNFWPLLTKIKPWQEQKPDWVIVSAPPAELLHTGLMLKKAVDCNLIIDLRDALFGHSHKPKRGGWASLWEWRLMPIFNLATQAASKTITVSESLAEHFKTNGIKPLIIANGYPQAWENYSFKQNNKPKPSVNLLFVGTLFKEQDPQNLLFKSLELLYKQNPSLAIQVQFLGTEPKVIQERMNKLSIPAHWVACIPAQNNQKLLEYYQKADALLHASYHKQPALLSTKVFEYFIVRKPILLFAPEQGDLLNLLRVYPLLIEVTEKEQFIGFISSLQQKNYEEFNAFDPRPYARERQAEKLLKLLRT